MLAFFAIVIIFLRLCGFVLIKVAAFSVPFGMGLQMALFWQKNASGGCYFSRFGSLTSRKSLVVSLRVCSVLKVVRHESMNSMCAKVVLSGDGSILSLPRYFLIA